MLISIKIGYTFQSLTGAVILNISIHYNMRMNLKCEFQDIDLYLQILPNKNDIDEQKQHKRLINWEP